MKGGYFTVNQEEVGNMSAIIENRALVSVKLEQVQAQTATNNMLLEFCVGFRRTYD